MISLVDLQRSWSVVSKRSINCGTHLFRANYSLLSKSNSQAPRHLESSINHNNSSISDYNNNTLNFSTRHYNSYWKINNSKNILFNFNSCSNNNINSNIQKNVGFGFRNLSAFSQQRSIWTSSHLAVSSAANHGSGLQNGSLNQCRAYMTSLRVKNVQLRKPKVCTVSRSRSCRSYTRPYNRKRSPIRAVPHKVPDKKAKENFDYMLESVVKIYVVSVCPNYLQPWSVKPQRESFGSGFCISGRRILTNAHVVANGSSVMVRKHGSAIKYPATVLHAGHECDLAILDVQDESFWHKLPYLELDGDLPDLQDKVTVVGYPAGGDTISLSAGVVSRVELQQYAHGATNLLALQIDAAINPGNSGGPALNDNKVVGVAFQHLPDAKNIGYVIPIPIIEHFLNDIDRHGKYTGFCQFGIICQSMDNIGIKQYFKMQDCPLDGGMRVSRLFPVHDAYNVLKKDDVILVIDGVNIASDGTIAFRHQRILFDYLLINKYNGDKMKMTIWRDGKLLEVEMTLRTPAPLVKITEFSKSPSYFVHAGFVFTPLVQPYLHEWGEDWFNAAPRRLTYSSQFGIADFEEEEIIVLAAVLVDEINYDCQNMMQLQVLKFNGIKIKNIRHLKYLVETNTDPFLRFDLDRELVICVERKAAALANARILQTHRIASPYSKDLKPQN